ncbi:indolepyruvate ferredoxin oxidoreductase subunit alpha [Thermincola ferriacetica]|uniref:indolepyruvate ferredoxin oxidoreductase subunit alpha n=1 Tax=Thermincola ferriacetica TaxID=281456 RepID=UPI000689ECBE|nr:4Fe-4S binding protein [Thermincola ferriacetica]
MAFSINQDICTACGTCAEKCPAGAIKKDGACYTIDASKCSMCGICAENCPVGASCER